MKRLGICLLLLLVNSVISARASDQSIHENKHMQHMKTFFMPEDSTKIHEKEDDRTFLKLFNIYMTTYNTIKENRVDEGQRKLILSFLHKLGNRLIQYVIRREVNFQGSKAFLMNIFESLDENTNGTTKPHHVPFKWGRK